MAYNACWLSGPEYTTKGLVFKSHTELSPARDDACLQAAGNPQTGYRLPATDRFLDRVTRHDIRAIERAAARLGKSSKK